MVQWDKCVCNEGMGLLVGTQKRGTYCPGADGESRAGEAAEGGNVWASKPEMTACGLLGAAPSQMSWLAVQTSYLEPSQF